jgi:serine/threonine protein kinase
MQDGGKSVYQHKENGQRLDRNQVEAIIRDLDGGLKKLHANSYIHGDAHIHNAVMTLHPRPRAYWIDFGKMAKSKDSNNDKNKFGEVAKTVIFMADEMSSEQENDIRRMFQIPKAHKTKAVFETPSLVARSIPKSPHFSNGATLTPKKLSFF